jgi:hypothetical protein
MSRPSERRTPPHFRDSPRRADERAGAHGASSSSSRNDRQLRRGPAVISPEAQRPKELHVLRGGDPRQAVGRLVTDGSASQPVVADREDAVVPGQDRDVQVAPRARSRPSVGAGRRERSQPRELGRSRRTANAVHAPAAVAGVRASVPSGVLRPAPSTPRPRQRRTCELTPQDPVVSATATRTRCSPRLGHDHVPPRIEREDRTASRRRVVDDRPLARPSAPRLGVDAVRVLLGDGQNAGRLGEKETSVPAPRRPAQRPLRSG